MWRKWKTIVIIIIIIIIIFFFFWAHGEPQALNIVAQENIAI